MKCFTASRKTVESRAQKVGVVAIPSRRWMMAAALPLLLASCTSPPSVAPLLRSAEQALTQEARLLQDDAARDAQQLAQTQATLAEAFEADLRECPQLTAPWVLEATDVYVAAREELIRHDAMLTQQRQTRVDNLRLAAQAQQRAIELLERQDQLITGTSGADLWRWQFATPHLLTEKP
jgi:hypothetical protein